ncbi:MAG TPA: DUF4124 domain-containing protein [Ideonella sp.]|nr:DUF4124 domain-containing protein [Ideonella sp.]
MKLLRLGLVTLLATLAAGALHAQAIWKWRTKDGRIEVSDRAPPMDIPEANILQRPNAPRVVVPAAPMAPADDDAAPAVLASAPAVSRADAELEAKRRKAQADLTAQAQAKQRAEVERVAAQKAENCRRARSQQAGLESGVRIARPNDKGEREFLDDKGRAEELQRTREIVAANCS